MRRVPCAWRAAPLRRRLQQPRVANVTATQKLMHVTACDFWKFYFLDFFCFLTCSRPCFPTSHQYWSTLDLVACDLDYRFWRSGI